MNRYLFWVLVTTACGSDVDLTQGLDEPLRVADAQFQRGELPGGAPLDADAIASGKRPRAPYVTPPDTAGRVLNPGEAGFSVAGRASPEAYAVGLALLEQGNGYWVLPVGSPDPANEGELMWRARVDLGLSVEPGLQRLRIAAIAGDGRAGTQGEFEFCVRSPIPDNLNSCAEREAPPALVVSLGWENSADLDLRVVAPGGVVLGERVTGEEALPDAPLLDEDANANCVTSGLPRENLVFASKPPAGVYAVYVNLHDACGEPATTFAVSTHVSTQSGEAFRQREASRTTGSLLEEHANGGTALGTFVTEFHVN